MSLATTPSTAPEIQEHQDTKNNPAKYQTLIKSYFAVVKIANGSSVI